MKKLLGRNIVRVVLIVGVLSAAYLIGQLQRTPETESPVNGQTKPGNRKQPPTATGSPRVNGSKEPIQRPNSEREIDALVNLMVQNPQQALLELAKLSPGPKTLALYKSVFARWAGDSQNGREAATVAAALPVGPERVEALRGVASGLSSWDAKGALDWASGLPAADSIALKEALILVGRNRSQPALAAEYLDKLADGSARTEVIGALTEAMSQNDPAATLDWLDKVALGAAYDDNVKNLFARLSRSDPTGAAALLNKVTEPAAREAVITNLAASWSARDPQAALAWVATLPDADGATRDLALRSIVNNWSRRDPLAVAEFIHNSPNPEFFLTVAPTLAQSLAASDPDGALKWVTSLPAGAAKTQALSNVLQVMSRADFPGAWNYAVNLPAGNERNAATGNLLAALSRTDQTKAVALLEQLPAGDAQLNATRSVGAVWAQRDPQAYSEWITKLPAGAQRDVSVEQLVGVQMTKDPQSSLAWANSINNSELRVAQIQRVLVTWVGNDREAPLAAMQTLSLTDQERALVMEKVLAARRAATRSANRVR